MALLKRGEIARFVVGDTVDPAAKEDSNPLECEGANGSVVGRPLCFVALVEGARPKRLWNGSGGPFDESPAQEFRASPAPVDPVGLATALSNGRNAGQLLNSSSGREAVALLAKGSEKTRCEDLARAGKTGKQAKVGKHLATTWISSSKRTMPAERARSCGSIVSTRSNAGSIAPGSVVNGFSDLMALMRFSMVFARRTLCAWKKSIRVSRLAR